MGQVVGSVPEFTQDGDAPERELPVTPAPEEVKEAVPEEVTEEVKDTPAPPAEKPHEEAPVPEVTEQERALKALEAERVKLLKEISDLRGTRRELKQDQVRNVEQQIDALKDVNPDDVNIIEKVLKAKGYVSKEDTQRMFYENVKNEELAKFLDKYPEYKPENDSGDTNWQLLTRELGYYKMPEDPRLIGQLLDKAHRAIPRAPSRDISAQKHVVQVASSGSRGVQRSSPSATNSFSSDQREVFRRGGWTDEEIKKMESRLN